MELKLYTFSKRKNSTKQPANTNLKATKSVYMKRETSVMSPTFLINNVDLSINYCKWDNNYYFVNDIVLNDEGMYELRCTMDVLATCKSTILNTDADIMYSSSSTANIIDKRIPITADHTLVTTTGSIADFTKFEIKPNSLGTIILGVTGKGSFGAYMLANNYDLKDLLDGVDAWWNLVIGEAGTAVNAVKQLIYGGSASECLKSAIALPITLDTTERSKYTIEDLYLGNYPCTNESEIPIQAFFIDKPIVSDTVTVAIPWRYHDWRDNSPYTQVYLYLPFVGLVTLPTNDLIGNDNLKVTYAINITSGDIAIEVTGEQIHRVYASASANIAMATAYGSTGIDTNKVTSSVIAGAGAVVAGVATLASGGTALPAVLGIAGGMAMASVGTIEGLGGTGFGSGGLGGGASQGLTRSVMCFAETRTLTDEPSDLNSIMGKPYFAKGKITNHSGYVQTEGFSLSGAYLEPIITQVNSMMDAGVYIE